MNFHLRLGSRFGQNGLELNTFNRTTRLPVLGVRGGISDETMVAS